MKTKLSTLAAIISLGVTSVQAQAAQLPPNTIDMGQSPVISQAPQAVQPMLVPSVPSMVNNEVQQYLAAQPTPAQVSAIKNNNLDISRLTASPYVQIPKPVVRSMAVNLAPGEQPPIVRLAKNMVTSIVVTDNEGNPWEVEQVVVNQNQFVNHSALGGTGLSNIITIEPTEAISWSNMSVTLKDKATPVIFILTAGQPEMDMRVDARIPGISPSGKKPAGSYVGEIGRHSAISEIDNATLHFLDGTIPETAERMTASTDGAQAWIYNNSLYVKTRFDVLYPSFYSKASTGEGVHVYRFDNTISPIGVSTITFTQRGGQPVSISFEKKPELYYNQ